MNGSVPGRIAVALLLTTLFSGCGNHVLVAIPEDVPELKRDMRRSARSARAFVRIREFSMQSETLAEDLPDEAWWFGPVDGAVEGYRTPVFGMEESFRELGVLIRKDVDESGGVGLISIVARSGRGRVQRELDALLEGLDLPQERVFVHRFGTSTQTNRIVDAVIAEAVPDCFIVLLGSRSPEVIVQISERIGATDDAPVCFASVFLARGDGESLSRLVDLRYGVSPDYQSFFVSQAKADSERDDPDAQVGGRITRY